MIGQEESQDDPKADNQKNKRRTFYEFQHSQHHSTSSFYTGGLFVPFVCIDPCSSQVCGSHPYKP